MTDIHPSDTTPLLGHQQQGDQTTKKLGKRERLLNMSPLQSFLILLCLVVVSFTSLYLLLQWMLPKDVPEDQKDWIKFPRSYEDVQHLSIVLSGYVVEHYYEVMACFIVTYLTLQAFAIPGSMMLSVLGGALFKFWVGFVVVSVSATVGALFCYFISYYIGHPIVEKYLSERIAKLKAKIDAKRNTLFFYFAFLRVTPLIPNWFMNVASPHLGIPVHIFFFGTYVGVVPNTIVSVQVGVALAKLASPEGITLLTPENIIMTIVVCACLILPILWNRHQAKKELLKQDPEAAHERE
ncbi:Transmembrane protein 41B [Actinomortierella ambigua]|uniref:Transmembrane protein 41B n=1 Tax=Actinomortierella ambigua TaxID=1343610 RepID=A0A9P6QIV4_9FUNG|nr:Transmembrane protein 41B [Actinomortierella ambigua]